MKSKQELKGELKALVTEKVTNTQARLAYKHGPTPKDAPERYRTLLQFWWQNGDLKEGIRALQLAYAFVRGQRYWVAERFCENGPSAVAIAAAADVTAEEVLAWLDVKPSEEELAAYEQHLAASRERAAATKAAARARRAAA